MQGMVMRCCLLELKSSVCSRNKDLHAEESLRVDTTCFAKSVVNEYLAALPISASWKRRGRPKKVSGKHHEVTECYLTTFSLRK